VDFAVIVTIMVVELDARNEPTLSVLISLCPTVTSSAVSSQFIVRFWQRGCTRAT
jgi:uncharacterized membrane protein